METGFLFGSSWLGGNYYSVLPDDAKQGDLKTGNHDKVFHLLKKLLKSKKSYGL